MQTAITRDIRVSVETFFQPQHSFPVTTEYFFAYRITIENLGAHTVQLLRRRWLITDGFGQIREVEGEGVVGEQPTIEPGQRHQYVSGCGFPTEIGRMSGSYKMIRPADRTLFDVAVPEFMMVAPYRLS